MLQPFSKHRPLLVQGGTASGTSCIDSNDVWMLVLACLAKKKEGQAPPTHAWLRVHKQATDGSAWDRRQILQRENIFKQQEKWRLTRPYSRPNEDEGMFSYPSRPRLARLGKVYIPESPVGPAKDAAMQAEVPVGGHATRRVEP